MTQALFCFVFHKSIFSYANENANRILYFTKAFWSIQIPTAYWNPPFVCWISLLNSHICEFPNSYDVSKFLAEKKQIRSQVLIPSCISVLQIFPCLQYLYRLCSVGSFLLLLATASNQIHAIWNVMLTSNPVGGTIRITKGFVFWTNKKYHSNSSRFPTGGTGWETCLVSLGKVFLPQAGSEWRRLWGYLYGLRNPHC